jgi:hypothetical protein
MKTENWKDYMAAAISQTTIIEKEARDDGRFQIAKFDLTLSSSSIRNGGTTPRLFSALLAFGISLAAGSVGNAQVPDRLRYIFDLPWCKSWDFRCVTCRKTSAGRIACGPQRPNCNEDYTVFRCHEFNAPPRCQAWNDGCSVCARGADGLVYCTSSGGCVPYQPSFTCIKEMQKQ